MTSVQNLTLIRTIPGAHPPRLAVPDRYSHSRLENSYRYHIKRGMTSPLAFIFILTIWFRSKIKLAAIKTLYVSVTLKVSVRNECGTCSMKTLLTRPNVAVTSSEMQWTLETQTLTKTRTQKQRTQRTSNNKNAAVVKEKDERYLQFLVVSLVHISYAFVHFASLLQK